MEESASNLEQAAEIHPRSPSCTSNLAGSYIQMRKYEKAEYWSNRALFLNPDYVRAYAFKTRLYLLQGETTKARQTLEDAAQAIRVLDENLIVYHWILVDIFERKYQEALDRLSLTKTDAFEDQFNFVTKSQLYGQIYGLMNVPEKASFEEARRLKAFDLVEYLLSIPGYMSLAWLRIDPAWAPLLSLPRF